LVKANLHTSDCIIITIYAVRAHRLYVGMDGLSWWSPSQVLEDDYKYTNGAIFYKCTEFVILYTFIAQCGLTQSAMSGDLHQYRRIMMNTVL